MRALIPVVQDDFPPSDRSYRRAGDAVLPAGRRIRGGVAGAAGQPLRSRPADSDHAGGTHDRRDRRHPVPGGVAAADRPGSGLDWTIQLEDTDELTASIQVGFIQDIVLVLSVVAVTPAWP